MKKLLSVLFLLSATVILWAKPFRIPGIVEMKDGTTAEYAAIELPAEGSDTVWVQSSRLAEEMMPIASKDIYCLYFWTNEEPTILSVLYYVPEQQPDGHILAQWGMPLAYGSWGAAYKVYRHYELNLKTHRVQGKRERYTDDTSEDTKSAYEPRYSYLMQAGDTVARRVQINSNWQQPASDGTVSANYERMSKVEATMTSGQPLAADPAAAHEEAYRTKLAERLRDRHRFAIGYENYFSAFNQQLTLSYEFSWLTYGIFGLKYGLAVRGVSPDGQCHAAEGRECCRHRYGDVVGVYIGGQAPIVIRRNHILSPRMTVGAKMDFIYDGLTTNSSATIQDPGYNISISIPTLNYFSMTGYLHLDVQAGLEYIYQLPKVSLIAGLSYVPDFFIWTGDTERRLADNTYTPCNLSQHGCRHIANLGRSGLHFQQGLNFTFGIGF